MSKRSGTTKGANHLRRATEAAAWDSDEPEVRALSRNEAFRALLKRAAERVKREGTIPIEEMRAFRELTSEEDAEGERLLAELERQTEEEGAARLAAHARNGLVTGTSPDPKAGSRKRSKAST